MNANPLWLEADSYSYAGSNVGQSAYATFNVPVYASSGTAVTTSGSMAVTYAVTTSTTESVSVGQVVSATEEDLEDIIDSDAAMAESRARGTRPWRRIRKELGL